MRRLLVLFIAAVGCVSPGASPSTSADGRAVRATDSVVLERTLCFGTCPAYRLRVGRTGEVTFVSRNPDDARVASVDTVDAWVTDSLESAALRSGFFNLPDTIKAGSSFCPIVATDHPTITIGVFGLRSKRVVYYTGCYSEGDQAVASALRGMQQLAARIDTLTRAGQWIQPARRR